MSRQTKEFLKTIGMLTILTPYVIIVTPLIIIGFIIKRLLERK